MNRAFPAKLFLFGEYSVLEGSKALLSPLNNFKAEVSFDNYHGEILDGFIEYAQGILKDSEFVDVIDFESVHANRSKGWSIHTNIPQGKGLGSSGAFIAAFYDSFKMRDICESEQMRLLGILESYFHSVSSGLDPYISYRNAPVLVDGQESQTFDNQRLLEQCSLLLYDSKISREASAYVRVFNRKIQNSSYKSDLKEHYIPLVNTIVDRIMSKSDEYFPLLQELSEMQLVFFKEMFPQSVKDLAKKTLSSGKACFKLCGAGGGGYYQVYYDNQESLDSQILDGEFIVPRF